MPVTMQRRSRMHEAVLQRGFSVQSAPQGPCSQWAHKDCGSTAGHKLPAHGL